MLGGCLDGAVKFGEMLRKPAGVWVHVRGWGMLYGASVYGRAERRADAPESVGAIACSPSERRKLFALRDEIVSTISRGRTPCARSAEWAKLPVEIRMAYLMVGGIDGELSSLVVKAWPEFTPPEREVIRSTIRTFARAARVSVALSSRWGDD